MQLLFCGCTEIREQDPLKQGLKPAVRIIGHGMTEIREQDPLKQGLKLRTLKDEGIYQEFVSKIH